MALIEPGQAIHLVQPIFNSMLVIPKVAQTLWSWETAKPALETAWKAFPWIGAKIDSNLGLLNGLKQVYTTTDPLISGSWACLVFMLECYVVSIITGNYSQVDKQWSIVPFL